MNAPCPACGHLLPASYFAEPVDASESIRSATTLACPNCGHVSNGAYLGATVTYGQVSTEQVGNRIAHFVLKQRLGAGGFGEVWLAHDENLGRDIAL